VYDFFRLNCLYKRQISEMSTVKNRLVISFIVAWIAYALTYFLRKPLGVVRYLGNTFFTSYLFDYLDQDRS
jgi:hypothetical protein